MSRARLSSMPCRPACWRGPAHAHSAVAAPMAAAGARRCLHVPPAVNCRGSARCISFAIDKDKGPSTAIRTRTQTHACRGTAASGAWRIAATSLQACTDRTGERRHTSQRVPQVCERREQAAAHSAAAACRRRSACSSAGARGGRASRWSCSRAAAAASSTRAWYPRRCSCHLSCRRWRPRGPRCTRVCRGACRAISRGAAMVAVGRAGGCMQADACA